MEHGDIDPDGDLHSGAAGGQSSDPLLAVRAELDAVEELPLDERAEIFERTHEIVVEELRALELG